MNKIYLSGNYVIVEKDGNVYEYPRTLSVYTLEGSNYVIKERIDDGQFVIPISQIGTYFDETGAVAYDEASLVAFLRTNTGFKTAGGGSPADADAQLFIDAASITDSTQKSAINQLVIDLKNYGIWTKMKAIYPFVGGTASSHKFNLKDPRDLDAAFRLVFNGGITHDANGITGNSVNSYCNTFLAPVSHLSVTDNHLSFYSRTSTASRYDMGAADNVGISINELIMIARYQPTAGTPAYYSSDGGYNCSSANLDGSGFFNGTMDGTTQKLFRNSTLIASANSSGSQLTFNNIYIGAVNGNAAYFISDRNYAFSSIGDSLTDTDAANFYTAVQAFNTTLSRQI